MSLVVKRTHEPAEIPEDDGHNYFLCLLYKPGATSNSSVVITSDLGTILTSAVRFGIASSYASLGPMPRRQCYIMGQSLLAKSRGNAVKYAKLKHLAETHINLEFTSGDILGG